MSPSQFQQMMERFDDLEKRVRRIEIWAATAGGAISVIAFFVGKNMLRLAGS